MQHQTTRARMEKAEAEMRAKYAAHPEINISAENARNLKRNRKPGFSKTATRRRARMIWISRHGGAHPICRLCARKADIHHKDGDPLNNASKNQDRLCRAHHTAHENQKSPRRR